MRASSNTARRVVGLIGKPISPGRSFIASEDAAGREFRRMMNVPQIAQLPDLNKEQLRRVVALNHRIHKLFNLGTDFPVAENNPKVDAWSKSSGGKIELGHFKPLFDLPKDFKPITPPSKGEAFLDTETFFAGTFKRNGKRIGLLRIPSYMPKAVTTAPFTIRYYLARLQEESDVLLIDQMNNPGGAVVFSDLLMKGLVGELDAAKHMRFAVKPTQAFLRQFAELIDLLKRDDVLSAAEKKKYTDILDTDYQKIHKAFMEGKNLSEPISLSTLSSFMEAMLNKAVGPMGPLMSLMLGVDITKNQEYSKPAYFLINELDFSGGDATPALFQDYERGPLVGVGTAGAGGTVEPFNHRVATEFSYNLTTSLMLRKDGSLVENYRVKPDISFEATRQDYRDGFKGFLNRLLTTLGL